MRHGKRSIVVSILVLFVFFYPVASVLAQTGSDAVITAVEAVAARAGRLLPAAVEVAETVAGNGLTVAVGEVSHDGTEPTLAPILRRITEEELLLSSAAVAGRIAGTIVIVDDPASADLVVRVTSTAGTERVLFSIQIVDAEGRIRAAGRLDLAASEELMTGLAPRVTGGVDASAGAGDDTANDPNQATRIAVGDAAVGRQLEAAGDADWYTFTVDQSTIDSSSAGDDSIVGIRVYTTGTTDTYIELYGPDSPSVLIAENDDFESANASVSVPVDYADAQYWVKVRGFSDSSTGPYDLRVESVSMVLDAAEPNNVQSEATEISRGLLPFAATIRPAGDSDWYFLPSALLDEIVGEADTDERTRHVAAASTVSDLDTIIRVIDVNGTEIASNDDGGEGGNARVVLTPEMHSGGGVYIEVTGYGDWTEGDYSLYVGSETITLDSFEPDNDRTSAGTIEINGSPQRRTFSSESDEDWIRLEVPRAVEGVSSGAETTRISIETYGDIDTYMVLYDDRNTELASSDDDGYGLNARIERSFSPGTYFLQITPLYLDAVETEYSVDARLR